MTAAHFEDHPTDPEKVILRKPKHNWSSLTDDEIKEIIGPWGDMPIKGYTRELFDKIDEALRRKNT